MQYIYLVFGWLFGLFLIVSGLMLFAVPPYFSLSGILFSLAGLVIFPPFRNFFESKTGVALNAKVTGVSVAVLFIGASIFGGIENDKRSAFKAQEERLAQERQDTESHNALIQEFRDNRESIVAEVREFIGGSDYRSAIRVAERYLVAGDSELMELHREAKVELQAIQEAKRTQIILEKLNGTAADNYEENLKLYRELVSLHPGAEKYQSKVNFYSGKLTEKKQEEEEERRQEKVAEERVKRIRVQFSPWDGSHRNLEQLIKQTMHDPSSYEHVETTYGDRGDHLIVRTVFRGANAFGGIVRNSVKAKVSLDGQILSIIE